MAQPGWHNGTVAEWQSHQKCVKIARNSWTAQRSAETLYHTGSHNGAHVMLHTIKGSKIKITHKQ